jgi:hypothetical protein
LFGAVGDHRDANMRMQFDPPFVDDADAIATKFSDETSC